MKKNKTNKLIGSIDPYDMGSLAGSSAFAPNDLVMILGKNNLPAKVRGVNENFTVRVIIGSEAEGFWAEKDIYPAKLGYPLSSKLWSQHQQKCYRDYQLQTQQNQQVKPLTFAQTFWFAVTFFVLIICLLFLKDFGSAIASCSSLGNCLKFMEKLLSVKSLLDATGKASSVTVVLCLVFGFIDTAYNLTEPRKAFNLTIWWLIINSVLLVCEQLLSLFN